MIKITDNLKNYGKDTQLWYHPFQGQSFELFMDTKKGYLVRRYDIEETRTFLVKHKHGKWLEEEDILDDDIV